MTHRRTFLVGLAASGLSPRLTWAEIGAPAYLSAARLPDGSFAMFGLDASANPVFSIPLPARGHAAACHPVRAEAVAFARRPETFAVVLNCATGKVLAQLAAPDGRHFYGHGVFGADGALLFTTENAFELGEGRIGIWDAARDYRRIGEMSSGGIGPHDIRRLPGTDTIVVANGGIETHPDSGRTKLNLPTMAPNLTYLSAGGEIIEQVGTTPEMRLNSIRHLDVRADGLVAFACQWQGEPMPGLSLQGTHRAGEPLRWLPYPNARRGPAYAGSIAFSASGDAIGVTCPRSDRIAVYSMRGGCEVQDFTDGCGIAPCGSGFLVTSGSGSLLMTKDREVRRLDGFSGAWDNHLKTTPSAWRSKV